MSEQQTAAVAIPPEVRAFAAEQNVEGYLPAVLDAARRALPEADLRLVVEQDPEVEDLRHIVVLAWGAPKNPKEILAVYDNWHCWLFATVPATVVCTFRLGLERGT
jgi:hypothetical protein